jgi:hypothetical protein
MEGLGCQNIVCNDEGHTVSKSDVLSSIVIADENILSVHLGSVLFRCQSMVYTGHQGVACHKPLSKIRMLLFKHRNDFFFNFVNHETALRLTDSVGHGRCILMCLCCEHRAESNQ